MADAPTVPYRPSNGTEGGMFYDQWCAHCKRDEAWRNRTGEPCPIWNDALAYPADHPNYPKELVETADVPYPDADPRCLAFDPLEVP